MSENDWAFEDEVSDSPSLPVMDLFIDQLAVL